MDKFTVEASPPAVTLEPPTEVTVNGLALAWSGYGGSGFQSYKVFRHTAQGVNETHTLLATIANPTVTNFVDTGLSARTRYYYKVYVCDETDTGTPSNEASAQTLGVPLGWTDGFEAGKDVAWTFTGTWGLQSGAGVAGSTALTDSPGDYANYSDTWAQTAVDLSAADWPVLVFKDRYALPPNGENAYVQIGAADNLNIAAITWTAVYSVRETRTVWREQQIDLSRWKGRHTVYIRFRLGTDGNTVNDGWAIDDVAIREHAPQPAVMSMHERFEDDLGRWLNGGWAASAVSPYEGGACALNHESQIVQANTDSWLVYGGTLDLSAATADAKVTLWARGWRGYSNYGQLFVKLSKDGGLNWLDLSGIIAATETWTRFQYAIPAEYRTAGVRLAVESYASRYDLDSKLFIDALGIGGEAPGAPVPAAPTYGAIVAALRPQLVVTNASDAQSDALTYSFEAYTNASFSASALVAQTPAIAGGDGTTAWQVDADLPDGAQIWWRCRAADAGGHTGPWSATATFHVGLVNSPPSAPQLIAPSQGATIPDASGYFVWFASADPDGGDAVTAYRLQISADSAFTNILIAADIAPQPSTLLVQLGALPGQSALLPDALYHWRVQALDTYGEASEWTASTFVYGTLDTTPEEPPVIDPPVLTDISIGGGRITLQWTAAGHPVWIERTASLANPQWTTVTGATNLLGGSYTMDMPENEPAGFYRVVIGQ